MKFVVLSDFHYRENWAEELRPVIAALKKDLVRQLSTEESAYLIFSGDFVQAGVEVDQFDEFVDHFDGALTEIGITKERRLLVPGNHDVSREILRGQLLAHRGALGLIEDQKSFNDAIRGELAPILHKKFANYHQFESRFTDNVVGERGGKGFSITNELGVFCLNTALCSHGGVKDPTGSPISDMGKLMVDTREVHNWVQTSSHKFRILVLHHPSNWLAPWAEEEIQKLVETEFSLVVSGHLHSTSTRYIRTESGEAAHLSNPALFTRKSEQLGYVIVDIPDDFSGIQLNFRQWADPSGFVLGSLLSKNETGSVVVNFQDGGNSQLEVLVPPKRSEKEKKLRIGASLEARFATAATCYSSYSGAWVERDFSSLPETAKTLEGALILSVDDLARGADNLTIQAPVNFGLTCVGHRIALRRFVLDEGGIYIFLRGDYKPHREAIEEAIAAECSEIGCEITDVEGLILDNLGYDKRTKRILSGIDLINSSWRIIILDSRDDMTNFDRIGHDDLYKDFSNFYLWSLSRQRVRELVAKCLSDQHVLKEDELVQKIVADLDALNLHRTPLNCLTLVKTTENQIDETPVNRTELIKRVLSLFFNQFNRIPQYGTRPDLIDCESALGFFSEKLIRRARTNFTKAEFFGSALEYAAKKLITIDADVLFLFLSTEKIVVKRGDYFEFRFSYWLHFFGACRMHHDDTFARYILSERRYAAYPEMIEFYSGIDRRREDAVEQLTQDLRELNEELVENTGLLKDLNPYKFARWNPSTEAIDMMVEEVSDGVQASNLPQETKDELADRTYDRSKAYDQEVSHFIKRASLTELVQAMRGAARALRNSDHVDPDKKRLLLDQVVTTWIRVSQVLILITPVLASRGSADFEGMGFYLDKNSFKEDWKKSVEYILSVVPFNIINWYQEDLFSRKLGALTIECLNRCEDQIGGILLRRLLILHSPPGWEAVIQNFIVNEDKNSFGLLDVYSCLRRQVYLGSGSIHQRNNVKRLAGMSVAKHSTGKKKPDQKLIERAINQFLGDA